MNDPVSLTITGRPAARRDTHPAVVAAAAMAAFAACWLAILAASSLVPPVDNIEQLVWMRALQWGYSKHPPLPTFLLWCVAQFFGASRWTTYVLGATMTLGGFLVLWRLLLELRGPTYAAIAILAILCITFYNGRLYYYNHNTVLMPLVVASVALSWRAFERRELRWWIALGVVLGLGALAKYQIAIAVASLACFWCTQRGWRDPVHRTGALAATLVALIVVTPHVLWLRENGFGPIDYGVRLSLDGDLPALTRAFAALNWLADELLNRAAPAFVVLALVYGLFRARRTRAVPALAPAARTRDRAARVLLLSWGVVPLASVPILTLACGVDPQAEWGTAFLAFAVPCAMELRPQATWNAVSMRGALKVFAVMQMLLAAQTVLTSPIGVPALMNTHWRAFPVDKLKDEVADAARARLGGRITVVAGPLGEAGALALELPEHPAVLIDGQYDESPGVDEGLVAACGALELSHEMEDDARPVGPDFPDLYWRVRLPDPAAGICNVPQPMRQDLLLSSSRVARR